MDWNNPFTASFLKKRRSLRNQWRSARIAGYAMLRAPSHIPYFSDIVVGSPRRIPRCLVLGHTAKFLAGCCAEVRVDGRIDGRRLGVVTILVFLGERGVVMRWQWESCNCSGEIGLVACLGNFRNSEVVPRDHGELSIHDNSHKSHFEISTRSFRKGHARF